MVSEGRSFTIIMFALASFMCGMITRSLQNVYDDTEPAAAQAFEAAVKKNPEGTEVDGCVGTVGPVLGVDFWNKPKPMDVRNAEDCRDYTTIDATVSERGYDYTGTCHGVDRDDGGSGDTICDAGMAANVACRDMLRAEFPSISARRRLLEEQEEEDDVETPAEGRGLRGGLAGVGDCENIYVPWVLVQFADPVSGVPFTRCSYHMGTKGNSATKDWAAVADSPALGETVGIWDVAGHEDLRCVAGWANRTTLLNFAELSGKPNSGMTPMIYLFVFITLCTFALCIKAALSHDEEKEKKGDDKKGGGDESEGSEE